MSEFCYVVERVEWDERMDRGKPTARSEASEIVRVFKDTEDVETFVDVRTYVEGNVAALYPTFEFQWLREHGVTQYSGSSEAYGSGWRSGVAYKIHYVPLD